MYTKNLAAFCVFLFLFASSLVAQSTESISQHPKRSSRLIPISETEMLQQKQPKKHQTLGAQKTQVLSEKASQKNENASMVNQSASETPKNTVLKTETQPSESSSNHFMVFFVVVVAVAFVNIAGAVWYFKYWKTLRTIPKPPISVIPEKAEKSAIATETMEQKNNHLAEYRLQSEIQEETVEVPEKRLSGEIELAQALRELKSKYQAKELETAAKTKTGKKRTPKVAKKIGTGIGEVELANRLEQMKKKHSVRKNND